MKNHPNQKKTPNLIKVNCLGGISKLNLFYSSAAVPLTRPEPESGATSSNFQGVAENADKLISDANQRYLAAETAKV